MEIWSLEVRISQHFQNSGGEPIRLIIAISLIVHVSSALGGPSGNINLVTAADIYPPKLIVVYVASNSQLHNFPNILLDLLSLLSKWPTSHSYHPEDCCLRFHHEDFVVVASNTSVSVEIYVTGLFRSEVGGLVVVVVEFHMELSLAVGESWTRSSFSPWC